MTFLENNISLAIFHVHSVRMKFTYISELDILDLGVDEKLVLGTHCIFA